jgi:hypothetical protein
VIAPCGLDCSECQIYKASTDASLAERIASAMSSGGCSIRADQVRCGGCRGAPSGHPAVGWFAGCTILKCCTDDHKLDSCHSCSDFPCSKLAEWAARGDRYRGALERLTSRPQPHGGQAPLRHGTGTR